MRIVIANAGLGFGSIPVVHFISKYGNVRKDLETVGKAPWDEQLPLVLVTEFYHHVAAERRRRATQVDRHIDHPSAQHADQLGLRESAFLIMQTAQYAARRLRLIILHETNFMPHMSVEITFTICLHEIAAGVCKHTRVQNPDSVDTCRYILHKRLLLWSDRQFNPSNGMSLPDLFSGKNTKKSVLSQNMFHELRPLIRKTGTAPVFPKSPTSFPVFTVWCVSKV